MAAPPGAPATLAGWAVFTGEVDAYLKDRFGLRHAMIKLHKDLTHPVLLKINSAALVRSVIDTAANLRIDVEVTMEPIRDPDRAFRKEI